MDMKSFGPLNIRCLISHSIAHGCVVWCFGRLSLPRESFHMMLGKTRLSSSSRLLRRIHQSFRRACTAMILTASSPVGTFIISLHRQHWKPCWMRFVATDVAYTVVCVSCLSACVLIKVWDCKKAELFKIPFGMSSGLYNNLLLLF